MKVEQNQETWQQLADVPFTYGVSAGGGLTTDGTYLYAADFSGDEDNDYIDLDGDLMDDPEERLDNLGITNGSVRFGRYNPETDTWENLPTLNAAGVAGDAFSAGNLVNPLFVTGDKLYYYQFRSGPQIAALYSYDLTSGTTGTWTQEWEKTPEDSPLIEKNAGIVGLEVNGEPIILHHTGGGDYNFARTDNIDDGGTHTQLTPNWNFTNQHFPKGGDWEYNATNDRLYHLSGDELVMWTHNNANYPGGSFLTSTPNGETPLASQYTLSYSLKDDFGWTNSGTGTSLWGNSVTAVDNVLYLIRGETSSDGWPFNEGRGLINNADFARVVVNKDSTYNYYYESEKTNLPDLPFNVGKGSASVYLNGYLYVTQGDTLTVGDDPGNVDPLNSEGIRVPGTGFARFAIDTTDDNYEDNDTLETAYDLTASKGLLLSEIDGQGISYAGDEDWYKITIDSSEQYLSTFVNFPYDSNYDTRYVDLEIYTPDGVKISRHDNRYDNSPRGNYGRTINTILDPGDYYLKASSTYSSNEELSGLYDLFWSTQSISSITDEYEDNNTLETATDIREQEGNYSYYQNFINFQDLLLIDEDWYQIEASSGESWLRLYYGTGNIDNPVTFNLYDADGNFVTSNTDNTTYAEYFNTPLPGEGSYYLQWVPSGEGNTYSFSWDTFGLPNLTVTDASTTIANPYPGDTVSVSWTVENVGEFDTFSYWRDSVYLSDDTTFDYYGDIYLTDVYSNYYEGNPLIPGSGYAQTLDITIPNYVEIGNKYLLFVTDTFDSYSPNGQQPESNSNDNVYSISIFIGDAPNLVITEAIAPTSGSLNSYIDVSWTVQNQGNVATTSNLWYDYVYFSTDEFLDNGDSFLDYEYIIYSYYYGNGEVYNPYNLPLDSNESYTVSKSIYLYDYYYGEGSTQLAGNGYLIFAADRYNYQLELNENDNNFVVPFSIAAPNLVITNVTAPTTANSGQSINVSWTVENDSSVTTGNSYWYDQVVFSKNDTFGDSDDIFLYDEYVYSLQGLPLEANETYTVNSAFTLPSGAIGSGYLLFKTDNYNYQGETDETDNVYAQAIDIAAPNLVITNVTAPTTATAGQSIDLSWTVENDSSVATGNSDWYDTVVFSKNDIFGDSDDIYLTQNYISSFYGLPLEANETYTVNSTINLPGQAIGSGYLLFKTDNYNYQVETDENDNVYVQAIDIVAPNLVITNVTAPITATTGQSINLSWTVENNSSVTTGNSYWYDRVVFSVNNIFGDSDDVYLYQEYVDSSEGLPLDPNETYTVNRSVSLPGSAIGSGYLLFKTDNYNYQVETDENDNVYAQAINIAVPNLTISTATAPSAAILGETVSVSWTVLNNGSVPANADWYDSVYLSNDQILDSSDQQVNSFYQSVRSPLAAGTSYTDTRNIIIPTTATGDRYLIFVTDYYSYGYLANNQQGETDETDNTYVVPISLSAPDLIISEATAPTAGVVNGTINVSWTVKNQGTVTALRDWSDYIYLSTDNILGNFNDTFITSQSITTQTPLAADGSYTINRSISLPNVTPGNYYLFFRADGSGNQGETDNNNNDRAFAITIGAPDLIVSQATVPTSGVLGSTVSVSWTVQNQGTVEAPADWSDYIYWSSNDTYDISDTFITNISAASQTPVAAGGSYTQTQNITLPNQLGFIGDGYLIFRADGSQNQGETNNNNNDRAVAFHVDAPDLIVSNTSAPESVTVGATFSVSWDVKNQGTVAANGDWYDSIFISSDQIFDSSDQYITSRWAGSDTPLAANGTYTATQDITIPSTTTGDRYLLFVTDRYYFDSYPYYNNLQTETDETNNITAVPINISASDLQVTATNAPTAAVLGETVELTWTVANQGTGTATRDWYDRVYLSSNQTLDGNDVRVTSELISSQTPLATGTSYTISKNVILPSFATGNQYLLFATDRDNYQAEINENNNVAAVAISLSAPDLIVSNAIVPVTGTLGKSVEVSWTVQNQGTTSASADWYDYVYLSNDAVFDGNADTFVAQELISAQTPLAAGGSYTITRNINLPNFPTGNRYLIFVADGSQQQEETDNNNNTRAVAINLNAPDLVVSNITAPVESLSGQPIDVAWTVTNQGVADAEGTWSDYVYLRNTDTNATYYVGIFQYTGSLAAGASLERTQSYTVPLALTGNYKVVVTTDYYGNIAEGTQNESNNTTTDDQNLKIQLSPVPNLQVSSVTAPSTAFSSQDTVVQWTVSNVGTGATNAPVWYDRVYLSLDQTVDNTDTYLGDATNPSYLNAGDSYSNSLTVTLPRGIDSNYYFLVQTDVYNYVTEVGNEGDNFGFGGPTDVNLTPPPDLRVTTVNAPNGAFSGQPMNLSWTVTNEGTGRTLETAWWDRVFMSADETLDALDAGDLNLGTFYHSGALNAGQNYTGSAAVNLPVGVAGNFFFFVQSDIYNNVYEHIFENNNTNRDTTATNITLTPPPDLEFESLIIPSNARSGSNLSINYRVTNFGATETPNGFWTDTFYLSTDNQFNPTTDINLGSVTRYGILNPGDGYDRTANFALSNTLTGTYYIFGVTDNGDAVFELDNTNNVTQSTNQVQIVSQPADLVVTDAVIPTTGEAGKTIQVQWTVKNQGLGDTIVTSWSDRIVASTDGILGDADDITLATFTRNGLLAPNGTYSRTETVNLPFSLEGNYQLFVVTDSENSVYEGSNEGNNNSSAFPVTISRQNPDLQVTAINLPVTIQSGTPINLSWTVENSGVGRTNSNYWYDEVYLSLDTTISNDDIRLGSLFHSGALNPSETYTASTSFNLPVDLNGSYSVLVRTDRDNNVIEGIFENNNVKASDSTSGGGGTSNGQVPITPTPAADLVVQSVNAPEQGIAGQGLSLTWTVVNNGANTGQTWYDAAYLSRDQVFDRSSDIYLGYRNHTGGLNSGDNYSATQSFNVPRGLAGRYYAFVVTDSGNGIYERTGESNNSNFDGFSTEIIIPPPSDLVVTNITVPNSGIPGQGINIGYTVQNQGTDTAYGSWTDSVYLSTDTQWDINDALVGQVAHSGDIAGGGSYIGNLNGLIPGVNLGNYHVIVRSDIRNQVPEVNEGNNTVASNEQIAINVEELILGNSDNTALSQGQAIFYRIEANAGETLRLHLDSVSGQAANELYVRYGEMPTRGQFDFSGSTPFSSDQEILIPESQAGTYYVMAYGDSVPEGIANYTLSAEELPFGIEKLSSNSGGNAGQITLEITGAQFDEITQIELRQGTSILAPTWQDYIDPTRIRVTFDLTGAAVGNYDLRAYSSRSILDVDIDGGQIVETEIVEGDVTFSNAFEVTAGGGGNLETDFSLPAAARFNSPFSFLVNVTNTGSNDIDVPVLQVTSPNGTPVALTSYGLSFNSSQEQVMVVGEYRPTVLAPGESVNVQMFAQATQEPSSLLDLDVLSNSPDLSLDWDPLESYYRDTTPDSVWSQTWTNFQGIVGDTWGELHQAMRLAAADLQIADNAEVYAGQDLILDLLARARNGQNSVEGFITNDANQVIPPGFPVDAPSPVEPDSDLISPSGLLIDGDPFPANPLLLPALNAAEDYLDTVWIPALTAKFGLTVGGMWSQFIHTNSSRPAPVYNFTDGDAVVEGNLVAKGFKNANVTQNFVKYAMKEASLAIQLKLVKGELNCDSLPASLSIADLLQPKDLDSAQAPANAGINRLLNWNNPFDIPGNTAGGVGEYGTPPAVFPDVRKLTGNVLLRKNTDECGKITSIDLTSDFTISVTDALDFIPGDLGAGIEQAATRPMRFLEENDWAHDVIFNVNFHPETATETISGSASALKDCDPKETEPPANSCAPATPNPCDTSNVSPDSPDCDPKPPKPVPTVRPRDPNDIIGPAGFGEQGFISSTAPLPYTIRFENATDATAPAQQVVITQQLDADLDWRTFRVDDFGWGDLRFELPGNRSFYNQRLDLKEELGFFVDVSATIDVTTGIATWTLTTIDPATGETPTNPLIGFLPPDNPNGVGDGFVSYSIRSRRDAQTGDVIDAEATIVFDTEEPINTPPIFNTLDLSKPTSEVNDLPATTETSEFLVSWAGTDEGSAIASYTIYLSDNGSDFTPWLTDTTLTESTYTGTPGHTYEFYAIATDNAGNTQEIPTEAQATTQVAGGVANIGDFVWVDRNADGIQDPGELGLGNVTVNLYNSAADLVTTTTTNANGFYSFTDVPTGDYFVEFVAPNGSLFSNPNQGTDDTLDSDANLTTGRTDLFTANAGDNLSWDAGIYQLASISGQKWHDLDGDGVKDTVEPGLKDWTIYLDTNTNGQLDQGEAFTLTDVNGNYSFSNLRPGTYTVAEVMQEGWRQTYPAVDVTTTGANIELYTPNSPIISNETVSSTSATNLINLDDFWSDPRFTNIKGQGYTTVIIDTGADLDHPLFGPDTNNDGIADKIIYQYDFGNNDSNASDKNNHGSHVASIATSIAPDANLIVLKVFQDNGSGSFADLEEALQWVNANANTYNIASVNLSLGDSKNWNTPNPRYGIGDELAAIAAKNILISAAAGNSFYTFNSNPGLAYPAIDPNTISVGAVWADNFGPITFTNGSADYSTDADRIASFSQRHPLLDIFAPGILITGANATGGTITMGGTSQAAPFITGIATLAQQIAQQYLERELTLSEFRTLLDTTSDLIIDGDDEDDNVTNTGVSYPRINAIALAEGILNLNNGSSGSNSGNTGNNGTNDPLYIPDNTVSLVHTVTLTSGQILTGIDFGNQLLPTNQPPTLININKIGNEDTVITLSKLDFTNAFNDADNDGLVKVQILTLPNNGILQLNGVNISLNQEIALSDSSNLSFIPGTNFNGLVNFSWNGFDGEVYALNAATVSITVNPVDDAPIVINPITPLIEVDEDADNTVLDITNVFTDVDNDDNLIIKSIFGNSNTGLVTATIVDNQLILDYQPNQFGIATISLRGTSNGQFVDDTFTLTVNPVNDTPILANAIADQTATETQPFTFTIPEITFTDVDDVILSYTLADGTILPNGITFDAITRTFTGTPTDTASGTYNPTVVATDSLGESASDTFTLTVLDSLNPINGTPNSETVNGTDSNDNINAGAGNDTVNGGAGDDVIDGGTGNDRLLGGPGNDTYIVDNNRDVVVENSGEGQDTIKSAATYTLTANVEDLILTGIQNISGTGNALNNIITGNSGNNLLKGLEGNDTLNGEGGNDTLVGGAGDDLLAGGEGGDQFLFGSGAIFASSAFGVDILTDFLKGTDKIALSKTSFTALTSAVGSNLQASEFALINDAVNELIVVGSSSARVVYNSATSNLFYNQNGATAGLGNGGQFAKLNFDVTQIIDETDFLVQA